MFGAPAQNMSRSSFYRIDLWRSRRSRLTIHKFRQAPLARFERILVQGATKQFVPQPHLVSADYVALTVVGDLFDLSLAEITFHLATIEPFRLSRQAHDSADLMKTGLSLRTKRREDITQIDGILGVPVKVGTSRKPWR